MVRWFPCIAAQPAEPADIMQPRSNSGPKYKLLLAALLLGAITSEAALAQHRGGGHFRHGPRIGVYIGAPLLAYSFYRPFYYPPYYYPPVYYPPVAVVPPAPPVYIEQPQVVPPPVQLQSPGNAPEPQTFQPADQAPQSSGTYMWYFCPDSKTYYPYVKQCPSAWQPVTPQPQG